MVPGPAHDLAAQASMKHVKLRISMLLGMPSIRHERAFHPVPIKELVQKQMSVQSRSWLHARQHPGDIARPVGVQRRLEVHSDQLTVVGRNLGPAARGVVDRQRASR
jgi:hypothetical protein